MKSKKPTCSKCGSNELVPEVARWEMKGKEHCKPYLRLHCKKCGHWDTA